MEQQVNAIWNLVNTGGVIALLILNLVLLLRGDLLPKHVYEKLTQHILEELCVKMMNGVRVIFREELRRKP